MTATKGVDAASDHDLITQVAKCHTYRHDYNITENPLAGSAVEALQRLDPLDQRVVVLVYFHKLTQAEAAQRLGLSKERVRAAQGQAMQEIGSFILGIKPRDSPN